MTIKSVFARFFLVLAIAFGSVVAAPSFAAEAEVAIASSVNVNTASAEEIAEVLDGIGLKRAEAIVEYRNAHGKFTSADQLLQVKGVGEKTLEKNRDAIKL
ncbi:MAG: ComEA family DNA-binding protein [bacterium]